MNSPKKLSKLNFSKQTVAKLNEETMALMRGGAAGAGAEGKFWGTEGMTMTCGSSTDITCQTQSGQGVTQDA